MNGSVHQSCRQRIGTSVVLLLPFTMLLASCTTVTRSDGSTVRIPAGGIIGSMAATNITCQDNVSTLIAENAKLRARVAELEVELKNAKKPSEAEHK